MNAAELEKGLLSLGFTSEDSLKAIRLLGVGATLSIGNALNALFEDKSSSNVSKRICPHCNNEYGSVSDLSLHAKKRHLASSLSRSMSGSAPRAAESPKPNKLPKDNTYRLATWTCFCVCAFLGVFCERRSFRSSPISRMRERKTSPDVSF